MTQNGSAAIVCRHISLYTFSQRPLSAGYSIGFGFSSNNASSISEKIISYASILRMTTSKCSFLALSYFNLIGLLHLGLFRSAFLFSFSSGSAGANNKGNHGSHQYRSTTFLFCLIHNFFPSIRESAVRLSPIFFHTASACYFLKIFLTSQLTDKRPDIRSQDLRVRIEDFRGSQDQILLCTRLLQFFEIYRCRLVDYPKRHTFTHRIPHGNEHCLSRDSAEHDILTQSYFFHI